MICRAALLGLATGLAGGLNGLGGGAAITGGVNGNGGAGGAGNTAGAGGAGGASTTTAGAGGAGGAGTGGGSSGIITGPGIIPFSAASIPSGTNGLVPFILQVTPLDQLTKRGMSIRGMSRRQTDTDQPFISTLGMPADNCQQSAIFMLTGGRLLDGTGRLYSTDSTTIDLFNATTEIHSVSNVFSISGGALAWTNPAFPAGSAQFCRSSTGLVYAVFDANVPTDCTPVQLGFVPAQQCPGISTPSPTGIFSKTRVCTATNYVLRWTLYYLVPRYPRYIWTTCNSSTEWRRHQHGFVPGANWWC